MPTWWIVGVALYVPLFLGGVAHMVKEDDIDPGSALLGSVVFLGLSTASALFWFG